MSAGDKGAPPPWTRERLVYCSDGPRVGEWHLLSSWQELRRLAVFHHETPHDSRTLGYLPIEETEIHPRWPTAQGRVLVWSPAIAAQAATKAAAAGARHPAPACPPTHPEEPRCSSD